MSKRVFDLLFGCLALIIALPLMGLSALMVYLEDGSPVFFGRSGWDGDTIGDQFNDTVGPALNR